MADFKDITRLLTSGVPDNIQRLVDETHPADVLEAVQEEAGGDYKYLLALPDDFLADVIDEADDDEAYDDIIDEPEEEIEAFDDEPEEIEEPDEIDEIEFPRTLRRHEGASRLCRWGRLGRWSR